MDLTDDLIEYICNPGLISIGARTITATTDTTNEAVLCKAMYETVRDAELRERIWGCTKKRDGIAVDATDPDYDWEHRYSIPSDCLYIIELENDAPFTPESEYILTDEKNSDDEINLLYIQKADVTSGTAVDAEIARFDSTLRLVLGLRLVATIAKNITKNRTEQAQAWEMYHMALEKAALANAYENRHGRENRTETESSWITSRLG